MGRDVIAPNQFENDQCNSLREYKALNNKLYLFWCEGKRRHYTILVKSANESKSTVISQLVLAFFNISFSTYVIS